VSKGRAGALPTFFVIGAARSGTTSLHHYLSLHPEIQMSATKEPHYFAGPEGEFSYHAPRVAGIDEYRSLFDPRYSTRGEASPSYSAFPRRRGVPARIKELVPEAKFVYLVRDPIDRAVSHYLHGVATEGEGRPVGEALADLDMRNVYLCASCYGTQLEQYRGCFPLDRVLIVEHKDLRDNRVSTLQSIFGFLGVRADFSSPGFATEYRGSDSWRRFPGWYRRTLDVAARSGLARLPGGARQRLRAVAERRLLPPLPQVEIDDELRAHLSTLLRPEAERLRDLTGFELSQWTV
jgi:hypothetical protein